MSWSTYPEIAEKTGGMDLLQDLGTNRGGHGLTVVGGTELVQLSLLSLSDKVLNLL